MDTAFAWGPRPRGGGAAGFRFARQTPAIALTVLLLLVAFPPLAAAQECREGRISSIFIDNHSIFDTTDPSAGGRLRWAYELANRLHVPTRTRFIDRELLFAPGECLDTLLLRESERILRGYPFISQAEVFPVPQEDGTQHVVVDTRDEWSTRIDLRLLYDDGIRFDGLNITEENLAGTGQLVSVFYRNRRENEDFGVAWAAPQVFSTRWDAQLALGRTRPGRLFQQAILYPFVGEVGRDALRQFYRRADVSFAYAIGPEVGTRFTHALMNLEREELELTFARRLGQPGSFTILGGGLSLERLAVPDFPSSAEAVPDGDFDAAEPAPPAIAAALANQVNDVSSVRVNLLLAQRNLRFVRRQALDALTAIEDVPLGTEVELVLGRSLGTGTGAGSAASDDLFVRGRGFLSFEAGSLLVVSNAWLEGRRLFTAGRCVRWCDVLGQLDTFLYWRPAALGSHTLVGRISGTGGWSTSTPFQLTLGGRTALRGLGEDAFPGGRRLLFALEDRVGIPGFPSNLLDVGAAAFVEAGVMWPGDAPFGTRSGFQAAMGGGLRGAFPAGSQNVFRVDLATPLTGGRAFREVLLRISFEEVLSLAAGFRDLQVERSRLSGVSTELFNFPK